MASGDIPISGAAPLPKSLALNGMEASQRRLAAWRLWERSDREKTKCFSGK
jgi:hypothetical protein